MKKKNLTIELLSEMDKHGINEAFNVSDFMKGHFSMPNYKQEYPNEFDIEQYYSAKNFLNDMKKRRLIEFDNLDDIIYADIDRKPSTQWFSNTKFNISFTIDGYNYLLQNRLNESMLKVNEASIRNYKSQRLFSIATIIFAGVAALMSILTYTKDNNNVIKQKKEQIQQMKQQKIKKEQP